MGISSPHAGKGRKLFRNVQVSRPLLELRSGHVVVFQVKLLQFPYVRQLVDHVLKSFTV